jgi:hypothetical protein
MTQSMQEPSQYELRLVLVEFWDQDSAQCKEPVHKVIKHRMLISPATAGIIGLVSVLDFAAAIGGAEAAVDGEYGFSIDR